MSQLRNKSVVFRANQVMSSWRGFAPSVEFASFKVNDLQAEIQSAEEVRRQILDAEVHLFGLRKTRDEGEKALSRKVTQIVNSMRGNENYGEDSNLYSAIGYVPTSEQRRGRPRKAK